MKQETIRVIKRLPPSMKTSYMGMMSLDEIKQLDLSVDDIAYRRFVSLKYAIINNRDQRVIVYLLRKIKNSYDLNDITLDGLPLFIYVCQQNHVPAIKYLSYHCDYMKAVDLTNQSFWGSHKLNVRNGLSYACTHSNPKLWIYLIKIGLQRTKQHNLEVDPEFEKTIIKHFCAKWYYKWISIANNPPTGRLFLIDHLANFPDERLKELIKMKPKSWEEREKINQQILEVI